MRTLLRCLVLAAGLLSSRLAVAAEEQKPSPEEAKAAALAWLKLVDEGKYADSWKEAAAFFKTRMTEPKWVEAMNQSRQPLGSVQTREFKAADFTHELPRAPRGDYCVIQFATNFDGTDAIETIMASLDKDGKWRMLGYLLKPAS
jgi:Protein of unknown function (DUF4019)